MDRIIFHVDVNNAFLSWSAVHLLNTGYEQDIRLIPSVIGGDEEARKGVVLAKSPVAKELGIVTAETLYQAKKKCPDLQIFHADFKIYQEMSHKFKKYLQQYSPKIEEYSIDECFLDMTGTNYLYKDYVELANKIRNDIKKKFGFTVNIGIANNKFCAKMASDFEKPDKVHTLFKDEIVTKLWPLTVDKLFMVGKRTAEELHKMNIYTVEELAHVPQKKLEKQFKSQAKYLHNISWGIDDSEVNEKNYHKNNSISTTETLPYDICDEEKLKNYLLLQTERVSRELREKNKYAVVVCVIFKTSHFVSYSAQEKLTNPTNNTKKIYKKVIEIFEKNYKKEPLRLIGVRISDLVDTPIEQISIFEMPGQSEDSSTIQETIDNLNKKFGSDLIVSASLKLIAKGSKKSNKKSL